MNTFFAFTAGIDVAIYSQIAITWYLTRSFSTAQSVSQVLAGAAPHADPLVCGGLTVVDVGPVVSEQSADQSIKLMTGLGEHVDADTRGPLLGHRIVRGVTAWPRCWARRLSSQWEAVEAERRLTQQVRLTRCGVPCVELAGAVEVDDDRLDPTPSTRQLDFKLRERTALRARHREAGSSHAPVGTRPLAEPNGAGTR